MNITAADNVDEGGWWFARKVRGCLRYDGCKKVDVVAGDGGDVAG